jgi:hypothetical protein
MVAVADRSSSIKIYLDGVLDATNNTASNTFNLDDTAEGSKIGARHDGTECFDGKIDEVGIWNTALTASQVQEIYNGTSTNLTKDLTTVSGSNLKYWNRMGD